MRIILKTTISLLLCTLPYETEAGVLPENVKSKLYLIGEKELSPRFIFHNETQKYYPLYQRAPCGKLMWMDREYPDSENGICRCINTPLGQRPLIFWEPANRCYFEFDQGPCDKNYWLNRNSETNRVECQRNPCPASRLEKDTNIDIESLIELETDYYFVDRSDNATCLRHRLELKSWHFNIEESAVSRFLYHNESQKFFPVGERGPCSPLMEFAQQSWPQHKYGECICKSLAAGQRPIVYWQKTDRCYFAYTQGPCKSGEWLVGYGKNGVTCQKTKCTITTPVNEDDGMNPILKPDRQFFIEWNFDGTGTCYETNTSAFCSGQQKLFVILTFNGMRPQCFDISKNGEPIVIASGYHNSVVVTGIQGCEEGYILDESGQCVKVIKFE